MAKIHFFSQYISLLQEKILKAITDTWKGCGRSRSHTSMFNWLPITLSVKGRREEGKKGREWVELKCRLLKPEMVNYCQVSFSFTVSLKQFLMPFDLQQICFWITWVVFRIVMGVSLYKIKASLMMAEKNGSDGKQSEVNGANFKLLTFSCALEMTSHT